MEQTPPLTLTTPRLTLRASRAEDAGSLFDEYTGRAEASHYLQRKAHRSTADTGHIIQACGESNWEATRRFGWSVIPHDCQKAIGLFYLFIDGDHAEMHYGLGPAFWGMGLATEAGSTIMDWVAHRSSLAKVSTSCATDHAASLRVLEKIGFLRVSCCRVNSLWDRPVGLPMHGCMRGQETDAHCRRSTQRATLLRETLYLPNPSPIFQPECPAAPTRALDFSTNGVEQWNM